MNWQDMKYWDSEEFTNNIKDLNHSDTTPHVDKWLKAFEETELENVKVVILGQDPYPTLGHAHGLAFSVPNTMSNFPPSLRNIFRELVSDLDCNYPSTGNLVPWARQGVLLLNTSLTTTVGHPGAHRTRWDGLMEAVFRELRRLEKPPLFILWGKHAATMFDQHNHVHFESLHTPHPSPFSAHTGFFGSRPFSWCNNKLKDPIDWSLT